MVEDAKFAHNATPPNGTGSRSRASTANRVVEAHRQARVGLRVALAFMGLAAIGVFIPHDSGSWLPLHLFLVGSLLTVISSVTQLLAVTWSTSPAPPQALARTQLACLAAGALAVTGGREFNIDALVGVGGIAVVIALGILALILWQIRSQASTPRFAPAIDAYLVAISFAVAGVALGVTTALADSSSWAIRARDTHLDANVMGLVGLIIAATVPYFVATQARMKMSARATPRRIRITTAAIATGTATALLGHAVTNRAATTVGYCVYATALMWLVTLLPRVRRRQLDWAGPRLVQLGTGLVWWSTMTVLLAVASLADQPDRTNVVRALVIGGYAQIVVASLAYLGPVLRGGGPQQLSDGFASTRSMVSLAAGNIAGVGALTGHQLTLTISLTVWGLDLAWRSLRLTSALKAQAWFRGERP
ncbi:MAG: hypothetical protein GY698_11765 [Actinomycetia bacterium]|nr:hypothetical protein [Actinomycetes bacterium]